LSPRHVAAAVEPGDTAVTGGSTGEGADGFGFGVRCAGLSNSRIYTLINNNYGESIASTAIRKPWHIRYDNGKGRPLVIIRKDDNSIPLFSPDCLGRDTPNCAKRCCHCRVESDQKYWRRLHGDKRLVCGLYYIY
jgi:hypothetical protein